VSVNPPEHRGEKSTPAGLDLFLRTDLVIDEVAEQGTKYFVIKDPTQQRFFRIKELEHFLITQFDGETSFDEVRRRASEQHRVLVSHEVLSRFVQKFIDLGLLVDPKQDAGGEHFAPPVARRGASRWSRILFLKIPLVHPEGLLDWLYPRVRWCLTPTFVGIMVLAIIVAVVVVVVNRESLVFGLGTIFGIESFLLIYITLSVVTALHELAHGITCRHFGGRVQDMGFLLMYFVPCFYCNVSDTYLFKEKRQRLWVIFAGAFLELFIWASAVLAWRVIAPEVFLSRVCFIVIAVGGVKTLFNFNPLIKLDGYYLLADYLGIANLRKEAIAALGRGFRRFVLNLPAEPPRPELAAREILSLRGDRFVGLFGAAALVYTVLLVGYVVFLSGGWVFEEFGSSGLGVFALALVGLLHKPAAEAASSARSVGKEKWDELGKQNKRKRFVSLWSLAILGVVFCPWQLRISSELGVLPQHRVTVRAPADGRIAQIHFTEGEAVRAGDLLLEYDSKALALDKETKQAELARATEELRLLEKTNPTSQEEIRVQERALETARARTVASRQDFERAQELWSSGLVARETFDQAVAELQEAESEQRRQEAQVQLVSKASPASRTEQIEVLHLRDAEAQKAVIHRLEAERARLEDLLTRSRIFAPISGTLTTYRFQEKLGEFLEEGDFVCEIVDDERVVIEMPVPEKEIDTVEVGQPVKFKVRGYPHLSFRAEVTEIAPVAERSAGGAEITTILVRAGVDNEDRLLKPGMTGIAKIYSGWTILAHALTRDLVRFIRTEFWL
jgi:multidrug resistance efflux pump